MMHELQRRRIFLPIFASEGRAFTPVSKLSFMRDPLRSHKEVFAILT
jgi:hypothetical protein